MKVFPKDCEYNCPHLRRWDMSIDDWTSTCTLLKIQIDDCDRDYNFRLCPLTEIKEGN